MREPTLRDRVEYGLTRMLEAAIGRLPDRAATGLGAVLGSLARYPFGIRRDTVASNLRRAFPQADQGWVDRVTREAYRHLGREAIEMIRLSYMTREEIIRRTEIPPAAWAAFQGALAERCGVLLVTGHYGNWEAAAAAIAARGVPIEAIVKRQRNPLVNAQVEAARRRLGIEIMDMATASKRVLRALSLGHVIGIVADQDARKTGIWVPFFGIPSSTYRGPAMFALRFGVPIFSAVARRLPDGRYRVEGERIRVEGTGDLERDVRNLTATLAAHLEGEIRKDPGQYFWFHRRWKSAPPAEPEGQLSGTKTLVRPDGEPPRG